MATLIKDRRVVTQSTLPSPEEGEVLRLEPTDDPAAVAGRLARVARVEVHFPKFGDGRGFSIGRLLRERYGYKGELRAVGHITRDHLFFLESCGFDAFEPADGSSAQQWQSVTQRFRHVYQRAADERTPAFVEREG